LSYGPSVAQGLKKAHPCNRDNVSKVDFQLSLKTMDYRGERSWSQQRGYDALRLAHYRYFIVKIKINMV